MTGRVEGNKVRLGAVRLGVQHLAPIVELCQAGKITTVIGRRYRLPEMPEALRYPGEEHAKGEVAVIVDELAAGRTCAHDTVKVAGQQPGSCAGRAGLVYDPGPLGAGRFPR